MSGITMPATAFALISVSADLWNCSPERGQIRNSAWAVAMSASSLFHVQPRHHLVVPDSAELVAHDGVGTRAVGLDRHDVLIAGQHLDVDVLGLQREAVLVVHCREVQPIRLALLELEDRPPRPQA